MYYPEQNPRPELRAFAIAVYTVSGLSAVLQLYASTVILGVILLLFAWFMNKAQRITAAGTLYASHAEWAARTLSRGTFFVFPAAFVVGAWLVWENTDMQSLKTVLNSDDMDVAMNGLQAYISKSMPIIARTSVLAMIPAVLWWVRRCVSGILKAHKGLPVDYPDSWI